MQDAPFRIFLSYAREDIDEVKELAKHFKGLENDGVLRFWYDQRIEPGAAWGGEIADELAGADLAIFFVTAHFLNSDFITRYECPEILKAQQRNEIKVYPLIAKHCVWDTIFWLSRLNVRPMNGIPIWSEDADSPQIDKSLVQVVKEIQKMLKADESTNKPPLASRPRAGDMLVDRLLRATHELSQVASQPILADLKEPLVRARQSIERVLYFKLLHDLLQQIQNRCFEPMNENFNWFTKDESAFATIEAHCSTLADFAARLAAVRDMMPHGVSSPDWIPNVQKVADEAGEAIKERDANRLGSALYRLERILNVIPGRLDADLQKAAQGLEISGVVDLFKDVGGKLSTEDAGIVDEAVRDLTSLRGNLVSLMEGHRGWQEIESNIRMIRVTSNYESPDTDSDEVLADFRLNWPFLRDAAYKLADDDVWSEKLLSVSDRLNEALEKRLVSQVLANFGNFCSSVSNKFDAVDTQLKELCMDLAEINKRLDDLLEDVA